MCDDSGRIERLAPAADVPNAVPLKNRALLPGLINAHSHAFQRVIRGRTEYRTTNQQDTFWTWREMMYSAAARLTPEDIYDASRMAFLEMVLSGITAVGEFHYLHHDSDGQPYDDPNLLAKQVVRAARDVGLRIALLRVAYARSGFQTEANPRQARFIENDASQYLTNLEALNQELARDAGGAWVGVAPHSVRAVPLDYLRTIVAYANEHDLPVHMHVAEQQAEVSACIQEYGRSPFALLETEGLLSPRFTAVHAIHVTPKAIAGFARSGAMVCACPTTERNLGDGVVPADAYFKEGVRIALGSDSHTQIDLLEDARALEYHLRLQRMERAVLDLPSPVSDVDSTEGEDVSGLAKRLFECATFAGARSIGAGPAWLEEGDAADFFTVDLNDPAIAGASQDDLLPAIVFSASRAAISEVFVGGKQIVAAGRHTDQEEVVAKFNALQRRLWS
ncbi:MAG: formimidoylglutamate deiminase [Blastocatellia bacterium]|nr:formimidoylglutamate deiminase [Blastocatellia bacterium]